jgi:hypothetical protein
MARGTLATRTLTLAEPAVALPSRSSLHVAHTIDIDTIPTRVRAFVGARAAVGGAGQPTRRCELVRTMGV